jgi:hypothetical protein
MINKNQNLVFILKKKETSNTFASERLVTQRVGNIQAFQIPKRQPGLDKWWSMPCGRASVHAWNGGQCRVVGLA